MNNENDANKWYALFVLTGKEEKVRDRLIYRLKDSHLKFIIPKRKLMERKSGKWEEKVRTIFPGYILINGCIGAEDYHRIIEIPGVLRILKDNGKPIEIPEEELAIIKKLIYQGDIIEQSKILLESDKVIVTEGPLVGLEGFIDSIDKRKGRAKVRLTFAGELRQIDLSVFIIQAV